MLELCQIQKHWTPRRGEVRELLNNLSLTVDSGETVAILGPSGSGKSTLLKIVAGLEPLEAGTVLHQGRDITHWPPEKRGFALMFQDFALFPHLNVQDNVAFGLVEKGQARAHAREQARNMLASFGLADFATAKVGQLSGGEQQRVALARALITRPSVLLLDEPFSALDAPLRLQLREEFRARIADASMTTLWVTHDETEARAMGKRGFRLQEGQLEAVW